MYFARRNPHILPDDLTVDVMLTWAATQKWKPETRHAAYGSYGSFLTWLRRDQGNPEKIEFPTVRRRPGRSNRTYTRSRAMGPGSY